MIAKMSSSSVLMRLLALLVVVALTIDGVAAAYCPTGCTCRSGEVRCLRARLNVVPKLPTDATIVDLRYNRLKEIPRNAFAGLAKLETLFLSENEISLLQDGCLDGLVSLRFLFLNNNRISNLPDSLFRQLQQLSVIYLENNDLWQIRAETFHDLPYVNRITMNNNKIVNIAAGAFENMPNLRHLRLDSNPVNCDCGVYDLWRRYTGQVQRHQMTVTLYCQTPLPLRLYNFQSLQERDFHCKKPEIIAAPHDMQLVSGETVVLPCEMSGDPQPEIVWMHDTNEISGRRPGTHAGRMTILSNGGLQISRVESNDIGIYECIGRNEVGETKTQPIRVQVEDRRSNRLWPPLQESGDQSGAPIRQHLPVDLQGRSGGGDHSPMFVHRPSDRVVALNGDAVVLDCTASGRPQPEILWYFNGRPVTQSTPDLQLYTNGSLAIVQPSLLTSGAYRCEARNPLGQVQATARIEARELPEILMAPQSQTIKLGKPLILECDADGNPVPEIKWQLNGNPVASTARITLENENTELIISSAQADDAGVYTCIAENENGFTKATATITVERAGGPPNLIIAPYDLEALSGTTIEIPCQSDSDPNEATIQITWHRDGRLIDPNLPLTDKYEVSGTGSLFVKNVTIADGGRYECSVKNEYGRATASALVTIRNNVDLAPGDRYVRIAFAEAAKEIDLAINNTIDTLFTNRNRSGSTPRPPPNYGDLLKVFRFPTGQARQLARAAEIYERTLVNIRKHVLQGDNLTVASDKYEFKDLLSREHLHLVAELSGCMEHREMPNCTDMCFHSKYRSIDGTCNNLLHPTWGASLTSFRRIEKPIYENGFSMPIGWTKDKLYAGYPKPSARLISTSLISTKEITPDERITHMVMQWGQFLDHDLDHAIPSVSSESWDGIDCKKTCEFAPPCYPIEVPPNDPRVKNRRCIDVVRSSSICGSGMTSLFFDKVQHREQINQLTSYIDASQVYGYSPAFANELRNLTSDEGLLRVGVHFPHQKDMLPFAAPQDGMDCRRNLDENQLNCFVAGDIRVNEQVGLLAMHTVWMREHNRIAALLRFINPHWDGDTLYQEARKIVGAQMQHITYKHWLPLIVGDEGMSMLGEYKGYDPHVEPTIANEFATAALRFGHTIINPVLHRLNASYQPIPQGHLQLHKAFFAPWRLAYEGGVDPLMRGLFSVAAKLKTPDQNLNTELTEKLFQTAHAVALDLAAINVQRGRDHGIPGYNVYRRFCNLTVASTFDELSAEISSAGIREKLQQLYGHPDNVDVWVGGILEDQVDGGKVGPLFRCLLVEQFRRLRDGDRFYYENPTVFMPQQLQQIKQANLGRVLCDSGDNIEEVTDNVFVLPQQQGGYKRCEEIPGINLYFWQDCGSCHNLPPLFDTYIPETYVKRGRRQRRSISPMEEEDERGHDEVPLNELYEVNEERVSGLEEVIGTFHKELKKLHKKIHKLEESCAAGAKPSEAPKADAQPQQGSEAVRVGGGGGGKPRRNHCVDRGGNTRLNNEVWSPNSCSKCECRHGQITCYEEKCPQLECDGGVSPVAPAADTCCPQCPPKVAN